MIDKETMNETNELYDLLIEQLEKQYACEIQRLALLPRIKEKTSSEELHQCINEHINTSRSQLFRLEHVFYRIEKIPPHQGSHQMEVSTADLLEMIYICIDSKYWDAYVVFVLEDFNGYSASGYDTLNRYASELGIDEIRPLLAEALELEKGVQAEIAKLAVKSSRKKFGQKKSKHRVLAEDSSD